MLIAKTDPVQSLEEHSLLTCKAIKKQAESLLPVWEKRLQDIGHLPPDLMGLLIFMAACHDLGKALELWQRYIRGQGCRLNHSLFSMMLAKEVWPGKPGSHLTLVLLAILSHHGLLRAGTAQGDNIAALGRVSFNRDDVNEILKKLGDFKPLIISNLVGAECARAVKSIRDSLNKHHLKDVDKLRFKAAFCFYHALLRLTDNEASATHKGNRTMLHVRDPAIAGFSQSLPATSPNEIQKLVLGGKDWLILRAGCGVGKTGAALAFAMEHIKRGRADRIIFTLPTQFTTNSMYWDMESKYCISKECTGIYHSEIDRILRQEAEDEDYVNEEKYQNSFFNKPVTFSTIDHLLYSLLHCYKYADRAFGNIFTSVVVFDEVHYYDHYTLDKIGQCLELMRELHIPHLVMTATMPQAILDRIQQQARGGYGVVTQKENAQAETFTVTKVEETIVDDQNQISPFLFKLIRKHKGHKQMVVVNRVDLAQSLAAALQKKLKKVNVLCYHARFCRQHRGDKERIIKSLFLPCEKRSEEDIKLLEAWGFTNTEDVILVSTQVCELSLDISADIMYSQVAPIDSIIQRGGRLHRKGNTPFRESCGCPDCLTRRHLKGNHQYHLYLFPINWEDEKAFLPYGQENQREWIIDTWKVLDGNYSFAKAMEWVDTVYTYAPNLMDPGMKSMILEDVVFGHTPSERFGMEDAEDSQGKFRVRDIQMPSVTVIPACYEAEMTGDEKEDYSQWGVKVPVYLFKKHKKVKDGYWFLDLPYTKEIGFQPERDHK